MTSLIWNGVEIPCTDVKITVGPRNVPDEFAAKARFPTGVTAEFKIIWDRQAAEELELFFAVLRLRQPLVDLLLPKRKWWVAAVMDPKKG